MSEVILNTNLVGLNLVKHGKVRDIYDLGQHYLIVSTDRLSAFDVIMQQGIPDKGGVLTGLSSFWFNLFSDVENHLVSTDVNEFPEECWAHRDILNGRAMLVKKAKVLPLECIVRGYIAGSGWKDYQQTGSICGIQLPLGLKESEQLPEPIFTPSTKAELGEHDLNIDETMAKAMVGEKDYEFIKQTSLEIYREASEYALQRGIIIADTKMEFGFYADSGAPRIILIDELLTPDSSRFWPLEHYQPGQAQLSFDKQYVRDFLLSINFNKQPPAPMLPQGVIDNTRAKYYEAKKLLMGK